MAAEETIAEIDLVEAMREAGYGDSRLSGNSLFSRALSWRIKRVSEPVSGSETVTRDELNEAIKRLGYTAEVHADKLVRDVLAHREPEWKEGDVVRDAGGTYYCRSITGLWNRFGRPLGFEPGVPVRPLTRIGTDA